MKKILSFIIISFLLIANQAYATVVKITPEIIDLTTVVNTFTVNVEIEDVTALQGFEFEIIYDPAVLTVNKVVAGNFLTGSLLGLGPTITSGKVIYGATSLSSGSTGNGILATITFTKKIESCTNQPIQLSSVELYDSDVNQLTSELHDAILTISPGDVNGDSVVDLKDSILILKIFCNINDNENIASCKDLNGDGKIGFEEVFYILRKIVM